MRVLWARSAASPIFTANRNASCQDLMIIWPAWSASVHGSIVCVATQAIESAKAADKPAPPPVPASSSRASGWGRCLSSTPFCSAWASPRCWSRRHLNFVAARGRVIFYFWTARDCCYLVFAYSKTEQGDLPAAQRKRLVDVTNEESSDG